MLTINTTTKKLYNEDGSKELCDIASALTPQKLEFIRAGGSYAVVFGKKLQSTAAGILGIEMPTVYAASKEVSPSNFNPGTLVAWMASWMARFSSSSEEIRPKSR